MRSTLLAALLVLTAGPLVRTEDRTVDFRGHVVAAATRQPLAHARVDARIDGRVVSWLTDADGNFQGSPSSRPAAVHISKAGFLGADVRVPLDGTLGAALTRAAAISGRITDDRGEPLSEVTVTAERLPPNGSTLTSAATAETDDRGEYRLGGLSAGQYVLRVDQRARRVHDDGTLLSGDELSGVRRVDESAYYPGVQAVRDAQVVTVSEGEERADFGMTLPPLDPLHTPGIAQPIKSRVAVGSTASGLRGRIIAADGRPLPQAVVFLEVVGESTGPGRYRSSLALTDGEGRYEFDGIPPATYSLVARKAGYLTLAYGQRRAGDARDPIELKADEARDHVDVTLSKTSVLAGRVIDDVGEPVEGAGVHLWQIHYRRGERQLVEAGGRGTHRSDDRGRYRIYDLVPGEYLVSAELASPQTPGREALAGYVPTYYPNAMDPAAAARVSLDIAQEVGNVDLAMLRTSTVRVSGVALDAAGQPLASERKMVRGDLILPDALVLSPRRRPGVVATDPIRADIDGDGRFEFRNVVPGDYVIQAVRIFEPSDEGEFVSQFVTVGRSDVIGLTVRLARGASLDGRVTIDEPLAAPPPAVAIVALPVDPDRTPATLDEAAVADIRSDGTFQIAGLSGPRVLRLGDVAATKWMLKAVRLNGRDVTDTPIAFGRNNQPVTGIEVVVASKGSTIAGRVVDRRGRAVGGATVVVFPSDRQQWTAVSRFIVSGTTDRNGQFSIARLPAGDYYAVAATSLSPDDARDPERLESFVPAAAHVTVSDAEVASVELRVTSYN